MFCFFGKAFWRLSVKSKDRFGNGDGKEIKFGVVITFKEIKGVNRRISK